MQLTEESQGKLLLAFSQEMLNALFLESLDSDERAQAFLDKHISEDVRGLLELEKLTEVFKNLNNCQEDQSIEIVEDTIRQCFEVKNDNDSTLQENTGLLEKATGFFSRFKLETVTSITGVAKNVLNILIGEVLKTWKLLQTNEEITYPIKLSSDIIANYYLYNAGLMPEETVHNIKTIEKIINENFSSFNHISNTNLRVIYLGVQFISKKLSFDNNQIDHEKLTELISEENNTVRNLVSALTEYGLGSMIHDQGHQKICSGLLNFLFSPERFEDQDIKNNLYIDYLELIRTIHHYTTSHDINPIDFALKIFNSKILSVFIIESLISNLGFDATTQATSNATTETSPNSNRPFETQAAFNAHLKQLSSEICDTYILRQANDVTILWKDQLLRIVKAFHRRPGGLPENAQKFISKISDDEVICHFDFINKLTGLYCSIELDKKSPLDDKFIMIYSLYALSHSIVEVMNEINRHNKVLSKQLKSLSIGLGSIILILAVSILVAYQSWLIFGLMLISTGMTALFSAGWFYLVEAKNINSSNNLMKLIEHKLSVFRLIESQVKGSPQFTNFTGSFVEKIVSLIEGSENTLTLVSIRMPSIIASTLMGISFGISVSLPMWAYCLNFFQPYIMVPAVLIAMVSTICYNWAKMPIEHKNTDLITINQTVQIKELGMFKNKITEPTTPPNSPRHLMNEVALP